MTTSKRPNGGDGVRTARIFLSFLEECSVEDLSIAENILSADKDLALALHHIRRFKERDSEGDPLTLETLKSLIQQHLINSGIPTALLSQLVQLAFGYPLSSAGSSEELTQEAFSFLSMLNPKTQIDVLIELLYRFAEVAERRPETRSFIRELAARALGDNELMFPNLHSLAQLRTKWRKDPFPYRAKESRPNLIKRLLDDAEGAENPLKVFVDLLREGLRNPADSAILGIHGSKKQKYDP